MQHLGQHQRQMQSLQWQCTDSDRRSLELRGDYPFEPTRALCEGWDD